jgi:hypothetical protein
MSRGAQNSGRQARKLQEHSKAPEIRQISPPGEREDYKKYSLPGSAAFFMFLTSRRAGNILFS